MNRLAIFDLDGTLIDSREDIASSANAARASLGLTPLPVDVVQGYVGEGARNLMLKALGAGHQHRIEDGLAAFFAHYGEHLVVRTQPYPGIVHLLEELEPTAVILTNKPGRFARPLCQELGIDGHFEIIWGEGDFAARKPDPRGALDLCAKFGVAPADARFIGDSKTDAATARNAKIPFVGVTWGFGTVEQMAAEGGTKFVHDSVELLRALKD
ncbi:MAG: HAD-IA family hydrolase [Deltaproteobacteria bacterium]|nr:HAD-IA family hydrolase [Deltaproteobacteria bacterium]